MVHYKERGRGDESYGCDWLGVQAVTALYPFAQHVLALHSSLLLWGCKAGLARVCAESHTVKKQNIACIAHEQYLDTLASV